MRRVGWAEVPLARERRRKSRACRRAGKEVASSFLEEREDKEEAEEDEEDEEDEETERER